MKVSLSNHFNTLFAETDLDFADSMGAPTPRTDMMDHTGLRSVSIMTLTLSLLRLTLTLLTAWVHLRRERL